MTATLTIHDEAANGDKTEALTLDFLTDRITVRELIRSRVFQEVKDHNARAAKATDQVHEYRGLVGPTDAERTLNGYRVPKGRQIQWEPQLKIALGAFSRNGFIVLVDDVQVGSLDQEIVIRPGTQVSFLKLVPLVGG